MQISMNVKRTKARQETQNIWIYTNLNMHV